MSTEVRVYIPTEKKGESPVELEVRVQLTVKEKANWTSFGSGKKHFGGNKRDSRRNKREEQDQLEEPWRI